MTDYRFKKSNGDSITFSLVSPDGKPLKLLNHDPKPTYVDWALDGDNWIAHAKEKE